jgi:hypothetical protein
VWYACMCLTLEGACTVKRHSGSPLPRPYTVRAGGMVAATSRCRPEGPPSVAAHVMVVMGPVSGSCAMIALEWASRISTPTAVRGSRSFAKVKATSTRPFTSRATMDENE